MPEGSEIAGAVVSAALPALVSPIIEAALDALNEQRLSVLKGHLVQALEQARLWEAVSKENARLAADRWSQLETKENIINRLRQDLAALQHQE